MESLALSHSFVAYESPESELKLKSLDELGLKIPNSAWVGLVGMAVALSVVALPSEAQASCSYSRCGRQKSHHSNSYGYGKVVTNGGRLNIRSGPSRCSHVIGKLYSGDYIKLTGRYKHGWAQLKGGGWVSASWLH